MNLRVRYLQQDKQFSFEPETSVSQCLQTLRQRLNIALSDAAFAQYGLFVSMEVDEKNALAVGPVANAIGSYLPEEVLLRVGLNGKCFVIEMKSNVELKSKVRSLKYGAVGKDVTRAMMVDESLALKNLLPLVGQQFGIDDAAEYSFQVQRPRDGKYVWLNTEQTLCELGLGLDQVLIYRKKFFVTDSYIDIHNATALHMLYQECKNAIVTGQYTTTLDQALSFSAWQLQITYGNYDPLSHVAGFLNLSDVLPPVHCQVQYVEEDVYRAHRRQKDLNPLEGKHRYVKSCISLSTYGTTCRLARETSGNNVYDQELVIGINCDAFITLHPETKDLITRTLLSDIQIFSTNKRFLQCQLNGGKVHEFLLESEEDASLFAQLLAGYIFFKKNKRKELFAQSVFSLAGNQGVVAPQPHGFSPKLKFKNAPPISASFQLSGISLEMVKNENEELEE